MGFDEKVVRIRAAGSGLGYCDFGSSIEKLAHSIVECGLRNSKDSKIRILLVQNAPAFADLLAEQVLWQARAAPAYAKPELLRA